MNRNHAITACKFSTFVFACCTNLLAPLILSISAEFGLSLEHSGTLFFFYYGGSLCGCILSGRIFQSLSKVHTLRFMLFLLALFSLLLSFAPLYSLSCICLFVLGFCTMLIQICSTAIPASLSDAGNACSITGTLAFSALGACGGLLLSGFVLYAGWPWRISYLLFAVLTLSSAVFTQITAFPLLAKPQNHTLPQIKEIITQRKYHSTFLYLFLYAGAEAALCGWLVTYLTQMLGFSSFSASGATALLWITLFIGRLICANLARRFSIVYIAGTLIAGTILCTCLIPLVSGHAIWFIIAALGLFLSGIWPLLASYIMENPEYDNGTTLSIAFLFSFLANTVVPYFIGIIAGVSTLSVAFFSVGGIFLALFISFALFHPVYTQNS